MRGDDGLMVVLSGVVFFIAVATLVPRDGTIERVLGWQRDVVVRDDTFRLTTTRVARLDVTQNDLGVDFEDGDRLRITRRPACGQARVAGSMLLLDGIGTCTGEITLSYCVEAQGICEPAQVAVTIDDRIPLDSPPPQVALAPVTLADPNEDDQVATEDGADTPEQLAALRPETAPPPGLQTPMPAETAPQTRSLITGTRPVSPPPTPQNPGLTALPSDAAPTSPPAQLQTMRPPSDAATLALPDLPGTPPAQPSRATPAQPDGAAPEQPNRAAPRIALYDAVPTAPVTEPAPDRVAMPTQRPAPALGDLPRLAGAPDAVPQRPVPRRDGTSRPAAPADPGALALADEEAGQRSENPAVPDAAAPERAPRIALAEPSDAPVAPRDLGARIRDGLAPEAEVVAQAPTALPTPEPGLRIALLRSRTVERPAARQAERPRPAQPQPASPGAAPDLATAQPLPDPRLRETLPSATAPTQDRAQQPLMPVTPRMAQTGPEALPTPERPSVPIAPDRRISEAPPPPREEVDIAGLDLTPTSPIEAPSRPGPPRPGAPGVLAPDTPPDTPVSPQAPPAPGQPPRTGGQTLTLSTLDPPSAAPTLPSAGTLAPPEPGTRPDALAAPDRPAPDTSERQQALVAPSIRPGQPAAPDTQPGAPTIATAPAAVLPVAQAPAARADLPGQLSPEAPVAAAPPLLSSPPLTGLQNPRDATPDRTDPSPALLADRQPPRLVQRSETPPRPVTPGRRPRAEPTAPAVAVRLPARPVDQSRRLQPGLRPAAAPDAVRIVSPGLPQPGPEAAPQPVALIPYVPEPEAAPIPLPEPSQAAPRVLSTCRPVLSLATARGEMLALGVEADCLAGQPVVIEQGGLLFAQRIGEDGRLSATFPAMASPARVTLRYGAGETVSESIDVPGLNRVARVAIVWRGSYDLNLHLFAPGLRDGAGHVWQDAPRDLRRARLGGGGYLLSLGDPALGDYRAEVISVPLRVSGQPAVMRLELQLGDPAAACLEAIDYSMVWADARRRADPQAIRLPLATCPVAGDMLRNAGLRDLVLARR
ncbi:MAG: hypothetical protein AAFR46_02245 [Pseudomonadota bacterium]